MRHRGKRALLMASESLRRQLEPQTSPTTAKCCVCCVWNQVKRLALLRELVEYSGKAYERSKETVHRARNQTIEMYPLWGNQPSISGLRVLMVCGDPFVGSVTF
jgi:hypothetical protein